MTRYRLLNFRSKLILVDEKTLCELSASQLSQYSQREIQRDRKMWRKQKERWMTVEKTEK